MAQKRPLITFALFTYNQERFIREAVNGAFSQTYSPLEIIISDDGSNDDTFNIIKDMVKVYNGNHTVVINRNERNIGIPANINKVMNLVSGELIVIAAGDDISMPTRSERAFEEWINNGKPAAMCSLFECIDKDSRIWSEQTKRLEPKNYPNRKESIFYLIEFVFNKRFGLIGPTQVWSGELINRFGPLLDDMPGETVNMSFRAWLFDRVHFIKEKNVYYRIHKNNFSIDMLSDDSARLACEQHEASQIKWAGWWIKLLEGYLDSLKIGIKEGMRDKYTCYKIEKEINRQIKINKIKSQWWKATIFRKLKYFMDIIKLGNISQIKWAIFRLFPKKFFLNLMIVKKMVSRKII